MVTGIPIAVLCGYALLAQLPGANSALSQRVAIAYSVSPEAVRPGEAVTLSVELTPKDDIRLFAPGASDFTAVVLAVTPPRGFSVGKPDYPIPERQSVPGTRKRVPVYDTAIKLKLPVTVSKKAKPGEILRISALLTYQTCDDRVTYRRSSVPLIFTVRIE